MRVILHYVVKTMERRFFTIDRKLCNDMATEYFIESVGLNRKGPKFDRIREGAMRMRKILEEKINLRAEYIFFPKEEMKLESEKLTVGGEIFSCRAFEQVDPGSVEGVFTYACCAGDYELPEENLLDRVYADIWGSAFTDAIRALIKEKLGQKCRISENFGPGFYGMNTDELGKLQGILDFAALGIEVRNSNIMVPSKSCAGMFFKVDESYEGIGAACATCRGNQSSCKLCQVYIDGHKANLSQHE